MMEEYEYQKRYTTDEHGNLVEDCSPLNTPLDSGQVQYFVGSIGSYSKIASQLQIANMYWGGIQMALERIVAILESTETDDPDRYDYTETTHLDDTRSSAVNVQSLREQGWKMYANPVQLAECTVYPMRRLRQ